MPPHEPENDLTRTNLSGGIGAALAPHIAPPGKIGNYHLIRKLGQGGMGMVFEAEQQDPKRPVALKVVRDGIFATEDSIKLFDREVQALARLKHSGIAAIYEAGQTEGGQRFFTMELVSGETLSAYLATHSVPRPELLRLFLTICDAVTYAHQRGVIHRDLKPSNIMVHEEGGVASIKVLDFGLARITDDNQTYLSEAGTVRGTLPYMSPEQVRGNPDEVDLRTDVYALGVILYEALSGHLPHELGKLTIHEAARVICEQPPVRLDDAIGPRGRVDEDLCTIVHHALEQDASQRYASVSALAEDIHRYLTNQPIQARPPSTVYQIRKLVARHRIAFGFAATVLALLIVFAVAVSVQARRIARERDRANKEAETARQVSAFLTQLFAISNPNSSHGNAVTARELLEQGARRIDGELKGQPEIRASLLDSMGSAYDGLGLYTEARKLSIQALGLRQQVFGPRSLESASSMQHLASIAYNQGDLAAATDYDRKALEIYRALLPSADSRIADALTMLGDTLGTSGDFQQAVPLLREALDLARRLEGPNGERTVNATQRLGMALLKQRDYAGAEPLLREAIRVYLLREGPKSTNLAATLNDLGNLLSMTGDLAGADAAYRRCRDTAAKIFGPDHPNIAIIDENLAVNLRRQKRYQEAEALIRDSMARFVKALGDQHPRFSVFLEGLGDVLRDKGDLEAAGMVYHQALEFDRAKAKRHLGVSLVRMGDLLARTGRPEQGEPLLRQGLAEFVKTTPAGSPEMAEYQRQLGQCLTTLQRFSEAEQYLLRSYEMFRKTFGAAHSETRESAAALAALYVGWGKPADAAKYRTIPVTTVGNK